jgi:hypothetical protein
VGHNFGASHTMDSGGIMSYDSAKELKFTGENPYEGKEFFALVTVLDHYDLTMKFLFFQYQVCQHIQSRINSVLDGTQVRKFHYPL